MLRPLPIRSPATRLRHAREDHEICMRLAASYRVRLARGEDMRAEHRSVLAHAAALRARFPTLTGAIRSTTIGY